MKTLGAPPAIFDETEATAYRHPDFQSSKKSTSLKEYGRNTALLCYCIGIAVHSSKLVAGFIDSYFLLLAECSHIRVSCEILQCILVSANNGIPFEKERSMTAMNNNRNFRSLTALLMASLLTVSTISMFAQSMPTIKQWQTKDRSKLVGNSTTGWDSLYKTGGLCDPSGANYPSQACVNAAISLVNTACAAAGNSYQKGSKLWQRTGFALILASSAFTGVGSAATIAGSTTVPKIFSTLGGTTGLGAVTATVTSNASGDLAGVAAVNAVMSDLQAFFC